MKTGDSEIARAQTKRSVFATEQTQESEADYQSRKQKSATDARDSGAGRHSSREDHNSRGDRAAPAE